MSNKQIAAAINLAPSSCHERIKALREAGVLQSTHALVNLRALGLMLQAILFVQLAKLRRPVVDKFLASTAEVPEVRSVFLVSGPFDLIVHVVARDMDHLKDLISDHFNSYPVVVRVETSLIFDHKALPSMPLPEAI